MLQDLISLFFPQLCEACDKPLVKGEEIICSHCHHMLPRTDNSEALQKLLTSKFYGKVEINEVFAFLYFRKHGSVQKLLHSLKYRHKPEIGEFLGRLYGNELVTQDKGFVYDYIIPVPLHKSRERRRGYNQSEFFSRGLGSSLQIPVDTSLLHRKFKSTTQTNKSRQERWDNVKDIFIVSHPEKLQGKNILLTDDVMTTGATLEACSLKLKEAGVNQISVATIAVAI